MPVSDLASRRFYTYKKQATFGPVLDYGALGNAYRQSSFYISTLSKPQCVYSKGVTVGNVYVYSPYYGQAVTSLAVNMNWGIPDFADAFDLALSASSDCAALLVRCLIKFYKAT